jgi:hypothetical protein
MSKDTVVSSVELELQQLLSTPEKHRKHEDGKSTNERQEGPASHFRMSSDKLLLPRPIKTEREEKQEAKVSEKQPKLEQKSERAPAKSSSASSSSALEAIWYSHWQ